MYKWQFVILHVDLDCFFASVHIKHHPFLKDVPLIIGADPKQGKGRGVISTCSYEARKFGLHSGMPISQAFKLCPEGVYVCSRGQISFGNYKKESNEVMNILKHFSSKFQQAGIDEAYLDVTKTWGRYGDSPYAIAKTIQEEIFDKLSLPVSIGVAETKSIAKIASDLNKPFGISVVRNKDLKDKLYHLPIRKIVGIGKKTEERINKKGIYTIGDIANLSNQKLFSIFGSYGLHLKKVVLGENYKEVGYFKGGRKSISSERTFGVDQNDWNLINQTVKEIVDRLVKNLEKHHIVTKTISIKIRFQGFETYTRSRSFNNYQSNPGTILKIALSLLEEFHTYPKKIRLVGVRLSSLKSSKNQLPLNVFFTKNKFSNNYS
ncbi:MAG: DNA polymerase IV [Candidatus Hodarchaeales archaeon]